MTVRVIWFRRDLRLTDHPALVAAARDGSSVLPLFVLDDTLRRPAGSPRLTFLYRTLRVLREQTDGRLLVRTGRPADVVAGVAAEAGAGEVHVSADFGPYGAARDAEVSARLDAAGTALVATGSPYAVSPGRVRKDDGGPFQVFTPFYRAWRRHGWPAPPPAPAVAWTDAGLAGEGVPDDPDLGGVRLPDAGEAAALARWEAWRDEHLAHYADQRNRPDTDATSRLSVYLKYGCLHPRTVLAGLGGGRAEAEGAERFRTEMAWRDFYADVLARRPDSARSPLQPRLAELPTDSGGPAEDRFAAWAAGRTGFPVVDAAMRQLLAEAWMPNRMRMVVASFLVKDLHLDWRRGARYFLAHLVDGDLASNNHGWQWVAGTGTDPAPYVRVFNPVTQGRTFDPEGDYVRRWIPELAGVPGPAVHEPWLLPGGPPAGYPAPIVDHAAERREALARYAGVTG